MYLPFLVSMFKCIIVYTYLWVEFVGDPKPCKGVGFPPGTGEEPKFHRIPIGLHPVSTVASTPQKKAFSNQRKCHVGSRCK